MRRLVLIVGGSFALAYLALWLTHPIPPHQDPRWIDRSAVGWDDAWERGRLAFADASRLPRADRVVIGDSRAAEGVRVARVFPDAARPFLLAGVGACGRWPTLLAALREAGPPPGELVLSLTPSLFGHARACPATGTRNPYALEAAAAARLERVPRRGAKSWFRADTGEVATRALEPEPRFSDGAYRSLLHDPPPIEAHFARAVADLEALRARGWTVRVVRLPIDPGLRAIEDRAAAPELFPGALAAAGIPYLDLGTTDATYDGSHLDWRAAEDVSDRIHQWRRGLRAEGPGS